MRLPPLALTTLCALALAACDRSAPAPEPSPGQAADQATREPVSIIRPDIEIEREEPPLAPLTMRIGFSEGDAELSQQALAKLATLLDSPQVAAGGKVVLRGHSDSVGRDEANLRASQRRAEAVRDWLIEHDVAENRIEVIALGEQNPIEPNALPDGAPNEAGRAANRRVELSVLVPENDPAAKPTGEPETLVDELSD